MKPTQRSAPRGHESSVAVAIDVVVTAVWHGDLRILIEQGAGSPRRWRWALPGGRLRERESLEDAAVRLAVGAIGVGGMPRHLQQVGAYDDAGGGQWRRFGGHSRKDARGRRGLRVVTVAYWAIVGPDAEAALAKRAGQASGPGYQEFVPVPEIEGGRIRLAPVQGRIVADALRELRLSLESRKIAGYFCPGEFTLAQLREVYEAAWGTDLDPGNFQRKARSEGFVAPLPRRARTKSRGRPARLWRAPEFPPATDKPMLRIPFPPKWRRDDDDDA